MATIVKSNYVELQSRKYFATELGKEVTDFLVGRFPKVLELGFTKTCEDRLDKIALGEIDFRNFLLKFWAYLSQQIMNPAPILEKPPQQTVKPMESLAKDTSVSHPEKKRKKNPSAQDHTAILKSSDQHCPRCHQKTTLEPSSKWAGRYFYCCHACRSYLESNAEGKVSPETKWILPKD